jgi:hypothetical protein
VAAVVSLLGSRAVAGSSLGGLLRRAALPVLGALAIIAAIAEVGMNTPYMASRFATLSPDFTLRQTNWEQGFALHAPGPEFWAVGMGLGSYLRLSAAAARPSEGPSYFHIAHEPTPYLDVVMRTPFYIGHRVSAAAIGQRLTVSFRWRSHPVDHTALPEVIATTGPSVALCQKLLLYSMECATAGFPAAEPGQWQQAQAMLVGPGEPGRWPPRPLEFSMFFASGAEMDFADVHLRDADGREYLSNGDFARGTSTWFFTDDHHLTWRIIDQYLTEVFETGLLGLGAWLAVIGMAMVGALRAARTRQVVLGAAVAGAISAMMINFLFDAILEAPRLALVMDLILVTGVVLGGTLKPGSGKREVDRDGAVVG